MDRSTLQQYLFREVEIVQDIVTRMANNQFYVKGWSITLIVASLLLKGNLFHYFVAFVPWLFFWVYDSHFLRLEKLYRTHYAWLIDNRLQSEDSLLVVDRAELERGLRERLKEQYRHQVPCTAQIMFSKAVFPFYLLQLVAILMVILAEYAIGGKFI
jgi:hypothetical protein